MIWRRADTHILEKTLPFIRRFERFNISLSSRITGKNGPFLPKLSEATLYVAFLQQQDGFGKTIKTETEPIGVVMIHRTGSIFPLLSPHRSFSSEEIDSLFSRVISPQSRLFSILGTERDVALCWPHLGRRQDKTLSYYLMTRDRDKPIEDFSNPLDLSIYRLTVRNCKRVFPLEEKYQHEEVLVHPERYNRSAHMLHFKKVAAAQHVLFAESREGPVAKAGTNSLGMGYCQIGGVYTLPSYRRLGISKLLMQRVLQWSRHAGYSTALFVQRSNTPAVELYRRLSFDVESAYRIIYMHPR